MPYKIIWETNSTLTTWSGDTTGEELLAFVTELHANPHFDSVRYSLHDFTACTGVTYSLDSIETVAALDGAAGMSNSQIKVGIATERADVQAMVTAYMSSEMSRYPVRVFTTIKEMRNWEATDCDGK